MMEGTTDRGDLFMSITNNGSAPDRLYAVKAKKIAKKAVLEAGSEEEVLAGEEKQTASLEIKPGETQVLSEEGAHVELFGLKAPLKVGDTFEATLYFETAGKVKTTVTVKKEED